VKGPLVRAGWSRVDGTGGIASPAIELIARRRSTQRLLLFWIRVAHRSAYQVAKVEGEERFMGWDISYHPIGSEEISSIYFHGLEDPRAYQRVAEQFGIDAFYTEQLRKRFEEARGLGEDIPFNKGHAFYVAIVAGFLRKHHYLRGGAFSFLADDPAFSDYLSDWRTLMPERYRHLKCDNRLTENYCGGVFLSHASLARLRQAYHDDQEVRVKLEETFSHGRLDVFWKAVDAAIADGLGLLEAAEVVEPDPFNLNATRSLSNLFNCYPDGALLYAEAAAQQLAAAMKQNSSPTPSPKRKWFFSRWWGQ
jgi:hypothetical protein